MNTWSVYLLKCCDNSLYCGATNNLENRIQKHAQGNASKYTRSRLPVKLMASRKNLSKQEAFRLEYQIKQLRAGEKISTLNSTAM